MNTRHSAKRPACVGLAGSPAPEIPAKISSVVAAFGDIADIGGDGLPDLVTPVKNGAQVALFTGTPDGVFTELRTFHGQSETTAAFAADLVPKSFLDVIALRSTDGSGAASVWSGLGENQWSVVPTIFTGSAALHGGVMAELEDPPGPDLVSATGQASLALWAGDGAGGLMCERVLPLPAATSAALIATGDVDGDGLTDIVVGHAGGPTVTVLRPQ